MNEAFFEACKLLKIRCLKKHIRTWKSPTWNIQKNCVPSQMNIRQSEFLLHSFRCQTAVKNLAWLRGTVMKNAFLYHRASARRAFNTKYIMYMVNKCVEAGSRESHEPRLIGDLIKDLLMNSNEPLAVAYRKRHQTDTHLNVDSSQQLAFEKRRVQ